MKNSLHQLETLASTKIANSQNGNHKKLRVVTFNYLPTAYQFTSDWIKENGHEHVLAVTTPGPKSRPTPSYLDVLKLIPRNVNTLVTTKMRTVLTPVLRQLKPDIILCFTFPHRISQEICQIPTYGAINIHPSVLPLYRGPNPMRQFYDGAQSFGATAHRIAEDYDTGEILSQQSTLLPEKVTHHTSVVWGEMIRECIAEGMHKAIAGIPGITQDHSNATYAAPFTDEEKWINFHEPTSVVLRKTLGLNLTGGLAKATINGETYKIHSVQPYPFNYNKPAGSVIKQENGLFVIATPDGAVKVNAEVYCPNKKYANVLPYSAFV